MLLSELFIDTQHSENELTMLGQELKKTGLPVGEIERILKYEVAPVCGKWMRYPTVGPWPMFDEADLIPRIKKHIARPWYWPPLIKNGLFGLGHVRQEWELVKRGINSNSVLNQL